MEIVDGNITYLLQQSLSNYALSNESKKPTHEISSVFKQKNNLRRYEILEDGTGKEKYIDELGKTIDYSVKSPVLHYMSDSSIVVYNVFSLTEKTPTIRKDEDKVSWGYKFAYKNLSFTPKYDISKKDEDDSETKGKITGGIKVKGLSISATEDSEGGAGEVKKYGTGVKVSAGVAGTEKEDGSLDREAHGSVEASLFGFVSREIKVDFSDNYMRKSEGSNIGFRQLPSNIQNAMLLELFADDEKKSVLSFTDKFTSDEYSQRMPMTKTDFQNIRNKALSEINNMNIPDYQYTPSDFNSFESCLEVKKDNN